MQIGMEESQRTVGTNFMPIVIVVKKGNGYGGSTPREFRQVSARCIHLFPIAVANHHILESSNRSFDIRLFCRDTVRDTVRLQPQKR